MTSTLPVNVIDIAPIFMTISALTESGPVVSSTRPPSTHGTTRSRSVIAAKLSSIGFVVEKEWSSSVAKVRLPSLIGRRLYARRVSIQSGTHRFGPDNATLSVLTHRAGAAAKAGHDL